MNIFYYCKLTHLLPYAPVTRGSQDTYSYMLPATGILDFLMA